MDANWLTATDAKAATDARFTFPTPSGTLNTGANIQRFRLGLRKTTGATNPTAAVQLWRDGVFVKTLLSGSSITSTSQNIVDASWDGSYTPGSSFTENWTGSNGAAWNATNWPTVSVSSTSTATIQSNAGQLNPQGANAAVAAALSSATVADIDITGTIQFGTTGEQYHSIQFRTTGGATAAFYPTSGYGLAAFDDGSGTVQIAFGRITASANTGLVGANKALGTSLWSFRVRARGPELQARFWSGAEPGTWDLTCYDSTYTSGGFRLASQNGGAASTARPVTYDTLVVADSGVAFAASDGAVAECRVIGVPAVAGTPTFVNKGTTAATTASSVAPTYPASMLENDLLILVIGSTTPTTANTITALSSPWVQKHALEGSDIDGQLEIWYRFVPAGGLSGTLSITVTTPSTNAALYAQFYAFRGVDTSAPFEGGALTSGNGTTVSMPAVTTTGANRLAVAFSMVGSSTTMASATGESGGDWTEAVAEDASATGNDGTLGLQSAALAGPATISGGTFTVTTGGWACRGFALVPPANTVEVGAINWIADYTAVAGPIERSVGDGLYLPDARWSAQGRESVLDKLVTPDYRLSALARLIADAPVLLPDFRTSIVGRAALESPLLGERRTSELLRTPRDYLLLGDSHAKTVGAGVYPRTALDYLLLGDARMLATMRLLLDSPLLGEARISLSSRALAEGLLLRDATVKERLSTLLDKLLLGDAVFPSKTTPRAIVDSLLLGDVVRLAHWLVVQDAPLLGDAVVKSLAAQRGLDKLLLGDSGFATKAAQILRTALDNLLLLDLVRLTREMTTREGMFLLDGIARGVERRPKDSLLLTDLRTSAVLRQPLEGLLLAELARQARTMVTREGLFVDDAAQRSLQKLVREYPLLGDAAARYAVRGRAATDGLFLRDFAIKALRATILEGLLLNELPAGIQTTSKILAYLITDGLFVPDYRASALDRLRRDDGLLGDSAGLVSLLDRSFSDPLALRDDAVLLRQLVRRLADALAIGDHEEALRIIAVVPPFPFRTRSALRDVLGTTRSGIRRPRSVQ